MDKKWESIVVDMIKDHDDLTLATIREDGYPQANTVSYASDGLTIYFVTEPDCSKIKNIQRSNKVSLSINKEYKDWSKIKGLSMAATAEILAKPDEIKKAKDCIVKKYPLLGEMMTPGRQVDVVEITPKIISVLNYEIEFGHTDLVEV